MNALSMIPLPPIDLSDQPEPFITPDGMAARAVGENGPGEAPPYAPAAALHAAEQWAKRRMLQGDRLLALRDRGKITAAEMRAGREIELLVLRSAAEGCPQARSQFRERLAETTGGGREDFWLVMMEAEATRFDPWRLWAQAFPVKQDRRASLWTLTHAVACEGLGMQQVADRLAMHRHRALALLRRSLHRYAVLGGWQQGDNPPARESA